MRRAALLIVALAATGCPEAPGRPPPTASDACARIGDRCVLPDGPIGICAETTTPCDEPPCLRCMDQH